MNLMSKVDILTVSLKADYVDSKKATTATAVRRGKAITLISR